MADKEQVRPLAPASIRPSSNDEEAAIYLGKAHQKKKCLKCCGYITAFMLVQITVVIILIFTVFRAKDPIIKLNGVTIDKLELINGTTTPRPGSNMTLTADVSVKNPNVASFQYPNTTTTLYYRGTVIGDTSGPPGEARAKRTMRMNVTVNIIADRLLSAPSLQSDMKTGLISLSSFTRVGGKVKMMIIRKHVVVTMTCSMSVNITSKAIQDQKCKRKVKL